jgi:hypothetical protein
MADMRNYEVEATRKERRFEDVRDRKGNVIKRKSAGDKRRKRRRGKLRVRWMKEFHDAAAKKGAEGGHWMGIEE